MFCSLFQPCGPTRVSPRLRVVTDRALVEIPVPFASQTPSERARSEAGHPSEDVREVALVDETRRERDLRERQALLKEPARLPHAEAVHRGSKGSPPLFPERAREVYRVHRCDAGQRPERERLAVPRLKRAIDAAKPLRLAAALPSPQAGEGGEKLRHRLFERKVARVPVREFGEDAEHSPDGGTPAEIAHRAQAWKLSETAAQKRGRHLDGEEIGSRRMDLVAVHEAHRVEDDAHRLVDNLLSRDLLLVAAAKEEGHEGVLVAVCRDPPGLGVRDDAERQKARLPLARDPSVERAGNEARSPRFELLFLQDLSDPPVLA